MWCHKIINPPQPFMGAESFKGSGRSGWRRKNGKTNQLSIKKNYFIKRNFKENLSHRIYTPHLSWDNRYQSGIVYYLI